jgi:hypothetical protein
VFDGMEHVVVDDAVSASGRVDLHTPLMYYRIPASRTVRQPLATNATTT